MGAGLDLLGKFLVTEMTADDYEYAMELWRADTAIRLRRADSREGFERFLARNPGCSFVAREDDRLAGAVMAGHDGRRGYLHHLVVHPRCRGKGLGRLLFERCVLALEHQGVLKTHLFVLEGQVSAREFWDHMGLRERRDVVMFSWFQADDVDA